MNIPSTSKVSNYVELQPLMAAIKAQSDHSPKNSLPEDTEGNIIENKLHAVKPLTIYNSHGIVTPDSPNSLIAYA